MWQGWGQPPAQHQPLSTLAKLSRQWEGEAGGQGVGYWCAAEPSTEHGKGGQCRHEPQGEGSLTHCQGCVGWPWLQSQHQ